MELPYHHVQVCAAVGLCQSAAGIGANASAATAATARKLLADASAGAGAGALGDPSPFCQFCTVAISYIKARRCTLRGCMRPGLRFEGHAAGSLACSELLGRRESCLSPVPE